MDRLDQIEEYLSKMTAAPWDAQAIHRIFERCRERQQELGIAMKGDSSEDWNNAEGIAALRTDAPWLVERCRELERERNQDEPKCRCHKSDCLQCPKHGYGEVLGTAMPEQELALSDRLDAAREWLKANRRWLLVYTISGTGILVSDLTEALTDYAASKDERIAQLERERDQLIEALRKRRFVYSRDHGLPDPTPAFATHVTFSLIDWAKVETVFPGLAETAIKGGK